MAERIPIAFVILLQTWGARAKAMEAHIVLMVEERGVNIVGQYQGHQFSFMVGYPEMDQPHVVDSRIEFVNRRLIESVREAGRG